MNDKLSRASGPNHHGNLPDARSQGGPDGPDRPRYEIARSGGGGKSPRRRAATAVVGTVLVLLAIAAAPAAAQRAPAQFANAVSRLYIYSAQLPIEQRGHIESLIHPLDARARNLDEFMATWRARPRPINPPERPDETAFTAALRGLVDGLIALPNPVNIEHVFVSDAKDPRLAFQAVGAPAAAAQKAARADAAAAEAAPKAELMRLTWALYGELALMFDEIYMAMMPDPCVTAPLQIVSVSSWGSGSVAGTVSAFWRAAGLGPVTKVEFDYSGPKPKVTIRNAGGCSKFLIRP